MTDLDEYIGITEVYAVQAWCRSVAKGNYRVTFDEKAETASIYRDHIVFPKPNARMTKRDAIKMRGLMVHETSHPMYQPDYNDVVDKYKINMKSPMGMVWNILLDCHAESCRARGWPGDAKALSEFGTVTGMHLSEKLVPQLLSPETLANGLEPNFDKLSIVLLAHIEVEGSWNAGMRISFAPVVEAFGQEKQAKAREIIDLFDLRTKLLNQHETAESLLFVAQDVYKHLWGEPPPNEGDGEGGDKSDDDDGNESGNDKKKGKGEPSDDGEPESSGEGDSDESEQGGEEGKDPRTKGGVLVMKSLLYTDHYQRDSGGNENNAGGEGQHFDFTEYSMSSTYQPCDPARVEIVDYEGMH